MDVINRLRTAVTQVLPVGNPITNDYEMLTQKASGGPGMLWKIYDAIDKSTRQEVSIFILEKKLLDRYSKSITESILEFFKKGVSQLTKLRHPKILSVVHPLEDSRESLAFATEPIFSSLANVLGFHDNLPSPPPASLKNFEFYDVEIRYGLLQVVEALSFLHNSAHIVHGNCCPEAIYINKYGCWKLAGFDFCIPSNNNDNNHYYQMREYDAKLDPILQAKLNYLAPEYGLCGYCDTLSDMFSVAILMGALYNKGRTIYDCMGDWQNYKRNVSELRNFKASQLEGIPDSMKGTIKLLLNIESAVRPDALQFSKLPYFEDVGVTTLTYLDLLVQKDNLQKSQFLKGLPSVIANLPLRVNLQRVVPSLSKECSIANMVPFILPIVFEIAKQTSKDEYVKHIFPALIPLFKITEPIQVMLIFLQNMNIILSKTSQTDIGNHILPMISRALDADMPQLRELCLNILPTFSNLVEQSSLKNAIIPKILKLYTSQAPLGTRVNCLVCLGQILDQLEKWYVIDDILPVLQSIPCKEPAIIMSILGIFKIALNHKKLGIPKEIIANKIIPFLFPFCIDNSLNLSQFNTLMSVINDMISRVETEQRKKLEQFDQVEQENKTLQRLALDTTQTSTTDTTNKSESEMYDFFKTIGFDAACNDKKSATPESSSPCKQFTKAVDLSIEEKTSLAQQQEIINRMKSEKLQPQQLSQTINKPQQKDLTSTLINSNLSNLTLRPSTQNAPKNQVNNAPQIYGTANYNQDFSTFPVPNNKPVDLSAFDSLNVISNQYNSNTLPMNQLSQPNANSKNYSQNAVMPNSLSMSSIQNKPISNQKMFNSQNMMSVSNNMMSNSQSMINSMNGMSQNSISSGQSIQNPFRQNYTSMNVNVQNTVTQPNISNNKLESNFLNNKDLADFLG